MNQNLIGKYEVVATLGRGSMGVVYKGRDPEIGRLVAIKTLKTMFIGNDPAGNEALQRFRQEARSAGKLHHPNIVTIFEAGRSENGSPYIVMEYIEGVSLETMIAEHSPLDPAAVLHYLAQIAGAIDYAHTQSVIHRDIKPSNVLIDSHHRAHLLDFGVAKLSDTSLTPAGTVVGTPCYMSPEQIRGQTLDGRTDIFSLAVVAFEALTGVRPFPGADFTTVVSNIIHKGPLTLAEVGSSLPRELEEVFGWGLSKEHDQRCGNGLEFIAALGRVLDLPVDGTGLVGGYDPAKPWSSPRPRAGRAFSSPVYAPETAASPAAAAHSALREQDARTAPTALHDSAQRTLPQPAGGRSSSKTAWLGLLAAGVLAAGYFAVNYDPEGVTENEFAALEREPALADNAAPPAAEAAALKSAPDGFDPSSVVALRDEELALLLQLGQSDVGMLRSVIPEAARRQKRDFLDPLLSLVNHKDLVVRVEVLKTLAVEPFVRDESALRELIRALDDQEPLVRGFTAKGLCKTNSSAAKEVLRKQLNQETSEVVQKVIADCLRRMKS